MTLDPRTCTNCSASVPPDTSTCPYCGTHYQPSTGAAPSGKPTADQLYQADFGIADTRLLYAAGIGAALLYALGWRFEDLQYLLAPGAVVLWAVVQPIWLAVFSFLWRAHWGQWLPGFAFSLPVFVFHILIIFAIDGHINDDALGISAAFAGASLLGWVLGRALHLIIRRQRAAAPPSD